MRDTPQSNQSTVKPVSDYDRAKAQWDQRIGDVRTQLYNWRLAAVLSLVIVIALLSIVIILLNQKKDYIYIAKVMPGQTIAQIHPIARSYTATDAQKAYFISQFIIKTGSLSLDPVVVRSDWMDAYNMVQGLASKKINDLVKDNSPFQSVGNQTKTIEIRNYHKISTNSFNFTWIEKSYNNRGEMIKTQFLNGLFTVIQTDRTMESNNFLKNPLGLKIVYFDIKKESEA